MRSSYLGAGLMVLSSLGVASAQECGCTDLVLLVDDTGSMTGAIDNVKADLDSIIDLALTQSGGDLRLGLITFKDTVDVRHPLTANVAAVRTTILSLDASGGRGAPEASDEALREMTSDTVCSVTGDFSVPFRDQCLKSAVLVTDQTPGGCDDRFVFGVDNVAAHERAVEAVEQNIQIAAIYVPAGGVNTDVQEVMQDYATTTGGFFSQVEGNGSGTSEALLEFIGICPDCNANGVPDPVEIATGAAVDCNMNNAPDGCDVDGGDSQDCDADGVLDECQSELSIDVGPLALGQRSFLTASGAEVDESVTFLLSRNGEGCGPTPPQIGGQPLNLLAPFSVIGTVQADGAGEAVLPLDVPTGLPLGDVALQVVAVRGAGGELSVKSEAVTVPLVLDGPTVEARISHEATIGTTWGWGYRLSNLSGDPLTVEIEAEHLQPNGTTEPLEGPVLVELDAASGIEEARILDLDPAELAGDHKVEVRVTDPGTGEPIDDGSARVVAVASADADAAGLGGSLLPEPARASGMLANLTVNARVEVGDVWRYNYDLTNVVAASQEVLVEVALIPPSGPEILVEGPTLLTLAPASRFEASGSYALPPDAEIGTYDGHVRVRRSDGVLIDDSPVARFWLREPLP